MKFQLLIILVLYLFPKKLCIHFGKFMDFETITFDNSTILEREFCTNNNSTLDDQITDSDLKIGICLKQRNLWTNVETVDCQNSSTVSSNHDGNCLENIVFQFNELLLNMKPRIPSDMELSLSLRLMNGLGNHFQSDYIVLDGKTRNPIQTLIKISINNEIIFQTTLTYTLKCEKNYYGDKCQNYCRPMDKNIGHYNCTSEGKRVCLTGWKGFFCVEAICDNCSNGQCIGPGNCSCSPGWTGSNCDICLKAADCIHGTCQRDTEVKNSTKLKPFSCSCLQGWGGQHCEIDLNLCINNFGLCKNNGFCQNYYGNQMVHYICQCSPGYYGRYCQIKTGDCSDVNFSPRKYSNENLNPQCRCYSGFSGSYCQINDTLHAQIDSIKTSMTTNGHCINSKEGYTCSCSDLFGGLCKCRFIKCLNNGNCTVKYGQDVTCSSVDNYSNILEFSSNFRFDNSSYISKIDPKKEIIQDNSSVLYFNYYFSSFVFVPLLFGILIVLAIKFRYKFRRKSRTAIKTIHNDLGIINNQIKTPVIYSEHSFLLNQRPLSFPFQQENHKNKLMEIEEKLKNKYNSGEETLPSKFEEDKNKSDLSNATTKENPIKISVICNPNLLINNYKNINESKI